MHRLNIISYDDLRPELKESYDKTAYDNAVKIISTFTEVDAHYKTKYTKDIDAAFKAIDKEGNTRYYMGSSVCGHIGSLIRIILNLKVLQQHNPTYGCNWIITTKGLRYVS